MLLDVNPSDHGYRECWRSHDQADLEEHCHSHQEVPDLLHCRRQPTEDQLSDKEKLGGKLSEEETAKIKEVKTLSSMFSDVASSLNP